MDEAMETLELIEEIDEVLVSMDENAQNSALEFLNGDDSDE